MDYLHDRQNQIKGGQFSTPMRGQISMPIDSLTKAGKPAKLAITAVMRKLVIIANALLRKGAKWQMKTA
jgi:transposase